jgi:tRNA threonylcarbamoyladenosine biosynthesis protein TsaE
MDNFGVNSIWKKELPTRRATLTLAHALATQLAGGDLLLLEGNLGTGKTFFTRALLRALGVPSEVRVCSPTFSLIHEYQCKFPISHADLYRLERIADVETLGLAEAREDGHLVIAEWALPYAEALGGGGLLVRLDYADHGRLVELEARDMRSKGVLEALSPLVSSVG